MKNLQSSMRNTVCISNNNTVYNYQYKANSGRVL